jgi:hypothetical protein
MSRTGKISRLPHAVREELNNRLREGEEGKTLLEWLNALPETKALMAGKFGGEVINHMNLSRWRRGGYRDWEARQEANKALGKWAEEEEVRLPAGTAGKISRWVTTRYAAAAREAANEPENVGEELKVLREMTLDVARLRRGEHGASRARLEQERLDEKRKSVKQEVLRTMLALAEKL